MPRRRRAWERQACYHITHRCHDREYRFRFEKYRRMYRRYLFEATKRFNFRVLTWILTSNHTHLLVTGGDRGAPQISEALQFVHGETAQHYNLARRCSGSFWANRFHATRIQHGAHLGRCIFYIDLNMVRAGAVDHPREWLYGTWTEFFGGRQRYRIVDRDTLLNRLDIGTWGSFECWYRATLDEKLCRKHELQRHPFWSSAIAVGDPDWLATTALQSGMKRFEIREAIPSSPEDPSSHLKSFFLGSKNQSKIH